MSPDEGLASQIQPSVPGSFTGRPRMMRGLAMLKSSVFAPIASASVRMAIAL